MSLGASWSVRGLYCRAEACFQDPRRDFADAETVEKVRVSVDGASRWTLASASVVSVKESCGCTFDDDYRGEKCGRL